MASQSKGSVGVAKYGSYMGDDGSMYVGDWNEKGQKHGMGHFVTSDGCRYDGAFGNGLFNGLGIISFTDGSRYEGEFMQGWFHGHGVYWRKDSMRFEGEFRGGKIWGYGLVTFADATNGFPRHEGYFQDCRFMKKGKCPQIVLKAQKVAHLARAQMDK